MNPKQITLNGPLDVLAMVPAALGFHPQESAVLLGFGGVGSFHARVDLPPTLEHAGLVADALVPAAQRNGITEAVIVIYSSDPDLAGAVALTCLIGFLEAEIWVHQVMRAHAGLMWIGIEHIAGDCIPGTPYDVSAHPLIVERIFKGEVVHSDRGELAESLRPDPPAVARLAELLRPKRPQRPGADALTWLSARCHGFLVDQQPLSDLDAARVLAMLGHPEAAEGACAWLDRTQATVAIRMWTDLQRRAPETHRGAALGVLAFAAWLSGNGALAWCAIDIAMTLPQPPSLAEAVGQLLLNAVSPETWEPYQQLPESGAG